MWKEESLDAVLVPAGLAVMVAYHVWLGYAILHRPKLTVISLNAESRRQWVFSMMTEPLKNGTLAVQTIRNNIMASTLLATTAITLCSIIGVFVSNSSASKSTASAIIYGNKSPLLATIKNFTILICFLMAFLCNVQSIRYYAHVSFLVTVPVSRGKKEHCEYVSRNLNRASYFWSLGLRAFYFSFPLFLWNFGPIPMFVCCCMLSSILYFLDTTTTFTRQLHSQSFRETAESMDGEIVSAVHAL
ncbi:hypothetical protein EUTSA_v10021410mg [Eutrema salsugineum]|uniref:DUF599 domain-containing protein n=1 Tax=Eutrema salsugineum TaxID=72664 RepID=V4M6Y4_EUTSA|nr:uncharacterized protein LOC18024408 [Eutrema salsugineum]ESQ48088.1 hypothetical protein EUTSA_v10021410mg [Eutrema salsugineum]